MVRPLRSRDRDAGTRRVEYLDAGGTIRGGPRANRVAAWRVNMLQVALLHQLHLAARVDSEVERAPGDEDGLVADRGQVDVRFGVKFRHVIPSLLPSGTDQRPGGTIRTW